MATLGASSSSSSSSRKSTKAGSGSNSNIGGNVTGLWETLQRFWHKSYAGDYLGVILLLAAYLALQFKGEPFHRMFRLDDPRIQHPHADVERVSVRT